MTLVLSGVEACVAAVPWELDWREALRQGGVVHH